MPHHSPTPPKWHRLLALGKELIAQPDVERQRELILKATTELVGGEPELWLNQSMDVPLDPDASVDRPSPSLPIMRRALEQKRPVVEDASVALPLQGPNGVLGVLQVTTTERPPLDEDEIALLEGLAVQSAAALQAGRQIALERWRLEQLSLVRKVSAEAANVLNLDELARRVANLVLDTFGYYYVALFTLEPDQENLISRASAGPVGSGEGDRASSPPAPPVALGQGIVGQVAQTGQEVLAGDVSREPHYRYVDVLPETRSEAALPLKVEDRILGVLDVQSDQAERFDETDVLVLRALADQIAIAVEDARLYSDLRIRADQLSAVAEVSRVVVSILDLDELLREVVTLIHNQFGYPFVHLFTIDPAQEEIVYRAGWPPGPAGAVTGGGTTCDLKDSEGIVAWVACHGEPVLANNVQNDRRYRRLAPHPTEARSQLAVPLTFGDEVLGILDVQSNERGAFTEDDQFLFQALADSVAIAIRNANLYRSERWRRQIADSMRDVAGLLSAGIELDEVLDAILDRLGTLLPCDASAIWLLRNETLCLSAVRGADESMCISNSLSGGNRWLQQALPAEQPIVRTAAATPEPLGATLGFEQDYSAIAAPLRAGQRQLGLLTLVHHTPDRYGPESRAMTAAFASYAAVAIENTRLYQRAQEQAYISTVLLQVAEATQALTTLDEVLDTVVRLTPMLVGIERCAVFLWDGDEEAFSSAAASGLSESQQQALGQLRILPDELPAFNKLQITREPVTIESADSSPSDALPAPLQVFEAPRLLPLLAHGELLGAMLVDYEREEGFGPADVADERMTIMRGVAYQAATAAESARLLEARQEEAYVSAALLQVAQAVVSTNELDEILEAIVRITPMLIGVEHCAILLWSDEEEVFRPVRGYGTTLSHPGYAPEDFPLLDKVREQNELIVLDSPDQIGVPVPPQFAGHLGLGEKSKASKSAGGQTMVALPLSVKGDVLWSSARC